MDMSSAFDIITRKDLIEIVENQVPEDKVRMTRFLLSNTSLDIKIKGVETESFCSNKGSPQGNSINGIVFIIYQEDSHRRARCEFYF